MALRLQILLRTSKATRILLLRLHQAPLNSVRERALQIPPLHRRQTCSMPTTLARTTAVTRDTAVGTVSQGRTSLRLLPIIPVSEVFPVHLDLVIIVSQVRKGVHHHPASVATKKMMGWRRPWNFFRAASAVLGLQGAFQSPSPRMLLQYLIFLPDT